MLKGMAAVFALVFAMSVALPSAAQTPSDDTARQTERDRGKQAREAAEAAALFSEAASTYVEIVYLCSMSRPGAEALHASLRRDVRVHLRSARRELMRLRPFLNEETAGTLNRRLQEMEAAEANGHLIATALAATESFRVIATAMRPEMRRIPSEVSLHTYNALKLLILASVGQPDWPTVVQTLKDSEKSWIALRRIVYDTNLRVLLSDTQSGLRQALKRSDAANIKFGARMQIASAGVLRDSFERMARAMARTP
jgi:hypothetical protein